MATHAKHSGPAMRGAKMPPKDMPKTHTMPDGMPMMGAHHPAVTPKGKSKAGKKVASKRG